MPARYRRLFRLRFTRAEHGEVDEEFRFHLQMRTRELEQQGVSPEHAREIAAAQFGDVQEARAFCETEDEHRMRRYRRGLWMENLWQDLRYGLRALRTAPITTAIAIACIAIGVGANLAIFTVVRGVLLRPLPFGAPESLVALGETERGNGFFYFSPANMRDVATLTSTFSGLAAWQGSGGDLVTSAAPRRVSGVRATPNLFTLLRARAEVGRPFDDTDTLAGSPSVIVLSDQLWRSEFGGDRSVIGRSISLGGAPYTVVGVMGPEFDFPIETPRNEYWIAMPLRATGSQTNRMNHTIQVVARLRDGMTLERAQLRLSELGRRLAVDFPHEQGVRGFAAQSIVDATVGDVRRPLLLLLGAVGLVFLIACANMASVLLARGIARRREVSIRTALGATRGRLVSQLMAECALLALGGAVVGIVTARLALGLMLALASESLPRVDAIAFDPSTVAVGIGASVVVVLIVSLLPALQATRTDIRSGITDGSSAGQGKRVATLDVLIGVEAALALMLLVGAGLLIRSFAAIVALDPGFETANRLTFRIAPPSTTVVPDSVRYDRFYAPAIDRLRQLAGVRTVGAISLLPVQDGTSDIIFLIDGDPLGPDKSTWPDAQLRTVAGDYFTAMGIPVRAGRVFTDLDRATAPPVVVINQVLAQRYFGDRNPIGRRLDPGNGVKATIIGVVGATRQEIEAPAMAEFYLPASQRQAQLGNLTFVIASDRDPRLLLPSVRQVLHDLAPTQALFRVGTLDSVIPSSLRARKLILSLLGVFAALAMALSAAGVYGVTSYAVSRRTREIGIRMALGADPGRVLRMVIGEMLRIVAIGAAAGLMVALFAAGVMRSLLYSVQPIDLPSLVGAGLIVLMAAILAAVVPARRASRIPATAAIKSD